MLLYTDSKKHHKSLLLIHLLNSWCLNSEFIILSLVYFLAQHFAWAFFCPKFTRENLKAITDSWVQTVTESWQLKTAISDIILGWFKSMLLKRELHTFPSIFYIMAQHPFRWAFFCPKFVNCVEIKTTKANVVANIVISI